MYYYDVFLLSHDLHCLLHVHYVGRTLMMAETYLRHQNILLGTWLRSCLPSYFDVLYVLS